MINAAVVAQNAVDANFNLPKPPSQTKSVFIRMEILKQHYIGMIQQNLASMNFQVMILKATDFIEASIEESIGIKLLNSIM